MVGKEPGISQGLVLFNYRCQNSIKEMDLEFKEASEISFDSTSLSYAVRCFELSLRSLSISHHGELGGTIISMAEKCPGLKVLRSIELGGASREVSPAIHSIEEKV